MRIDVECWVGLKEGPLNLEVDCTAYCEGEEHTEKVPANVCHLEKGLSDTREMGFDGFT